MALGGVVEEKGRIRRLLIGLSYYPIGPMGGVALRHATLLR